MDHANLIGRFLPDGVLRVIDDEYREKYIKYSDAPSSNFGSEVCWGQDFLFKTEKGRIFNFALPYPFPNGVLWAVEPHPRGRSVRSIATAP